ncbi:hypothetical protein [Terriglobus sp.]|uniref:hypothetical protein n=1 Tax=Terriglobus sp. TaxID=1889013 RepID=UPI003B00D4A5
MRSALLTSFCAALCCAAVISAGAKAQAAPESSAAPLSLATPATWTPAADGTVLLAAESAAPAFSSSTDAADVDASLPDAPVPAGEGQAGAAHLPSTQPIAPKYTVVILPGQGAVPLSAGSKVIFGFREVSSPFSLFADVLSATYSQAVDSQPHYGQGWGPYGQRVGAAVVRGSIQGLATQAVFDPIFRDDPRYYVLGRQHKFLNRVVYAATRVVITRTDSGHNTLNAPLLLGYAAAAGANFAYYPERDRDFGDAATGYAGSLGGSVLGMEVNEFLDDALHIIHFRRN